MMKEITRTSVMADILKVHGEPAAQVLTQYGIHCVSCTFNSYDTVEAGAKLHGFSDQEVEHLISDLNKITTEDR